MKDIPIKYIEELIEALEECEYDQEVSKDKVFINKLWCISRKNTLTDLIKYWKEDMNDWDAPSKEKTINDSEVQEVLKILNDEEEL